MSEAAATAAGVAASFAPRADEIVDRRAVTMSHDRQRIAIAQDVARGAVPHEPDSDVADAWLCQGVISV